jgi:hypothetical protein
MKAYSLDLRLKVLAAALHGDRTIREVADAEGGTTFVDKVLALHRAGQDLAPRPHGGGYPARLLPRHEKLLRAQEVPADELPTSRGVKGGRCVE